jgi:hypothetical protein
MFRGTEFVLEHDENLIFYENNMNDIVQLGGFKLCYFDNNINYQLVFYNDEPLVCSVKIGNFHSNMEEVDTIDDMVTMLGYKSETYYTYMNGTPHYVKHIYPKEITFMLFDSWHDDHYRKIWMFTGSRHPLNYKHPY